MTVEMNLDEQHSVAILGLPLSNLTENQAVRALQRLIESGGTHQVCAMNVGTWLKALGDAHLHRIVAGSSLVFPDAMPLVWASGLLGCPLAERISAVDLVSRLAELSAQNGYRIFLLGAKPGATERARRMLEQKYPGVRIVGTHAPAQGNLIEMDHSEILSRIHAASPDILLVAFGNPKQEKWIWMHRKRLGVPLAMGVGRSFDILAGDMRRASSWLQRCGLGWVKRRLQEPMRLGPRYLRDALGLCRRLPVALLAAWWQRPYLGHSQLSTTMTPQAMHLNIYGRLGAETADSVLEATAASIVNGVKMVAHLDEVQQVTPAGFGALLDARRQLLQAGLTLTLAGLNLKIRFLLFAWNLERLFDEWQPAVPRQRQPISRADRQIRAGLAADRGAFPAQTRFRG